jgi:pimeloyl-ACP methyl ester carboxylesterase
MRLLTSSSFSPALGAWLERGRHHNVCGRRVFVLDVPARQASAARPPLLIVHGFPTSSFDWHLALSELSKTRRVVLFDLPGFGFSDKPERYSYSLFEQTDVVAALMERLGLSQPHLVAHDLGVSIACELLARRQRKLLKGELASVTLMSAGVYADLAKVTNSQRVLLTPLGPSFAGLGIAAVFKQQVQKVFARPIADDEVAAMWEQILFLDGHKRLAQIASYLRERTRFEERWISALRTSENMPVHLLWGDGDPTAVVAIAERLAGEIPGARLTRLGNVGHYPQLEAPIETSSAIEAWLTSLDARQAETNTVSA